MSFNGAGTIQSLCSEERKCSLSERHSLADVFSPPQATQKGHYGPSPYCSAIKKRREKGKERKCGRIMVPKSPGVVWPGKVGSCWTER